MAAPGEDAAIAHRYDTVAVVAGPGRERIVDRGYVVLGNEALATNLRGRAVAAGVRMVRGEAAGAAPHHDATVLVTRAGAVVAARAVIDASGAPAALVRAARPQSWQVAHGLVVRTDPPIAAPGSCVLMDWTPVPREPDPQPSFLYVLALDDGRALVEETVLAAPRPLAAAVLARRLAARLDAAGARIVEVERTETVRIPMGLGAPRPQPVVGFGAAGGMIHPVTGYSVAASLRRAPVLAGAIAAAIRRGATTAAIAAAGWDAVWPAERRRARALELFGFDAIAHMDARRLGELFDTFFALPTDDWAGFLAGTLPPRAVAAVMRRSFATAPWSLRRSLVRGDPRRLAAALRS